MVPSMRTLQGPQFGIWSRDRLTWTRLLWAVFLFHGVLDGIVTAWSVLVARGTTIEANPVLSHYMYFVFHNVLAANHPISRAARSWQYATEYLAVSVFGFKVLVVGALCLAAYRYVPRSRLTRVWVGVLAAGGAVVVANNFVSML